MAKYLILNADDLGISVPTNLAIERAFRRGALSSASLMASMDATQHALERVVRPNPTLGIGLHISLTSGRPTLAPSQVPLLVGPDGVFRYAFAGLWRLVRSSRGMEALLQIAREMAAQAARLDEMGLHLDHFDSHHHVHMIPEIFALAAPMADSRGAAIRIADEPLDARSRGFHGLWQCLAGGRLLKKMILSTFARRIRRRLKPRHAADHYFGMLDVGRMTHTRLAAILARLRDGATEINVHPGPSVWVQSHLDCSRQDQRFLRRPERAAELEALLDSSLRPQLDSLGIRLVRFQDVPELSRSPQPAQAE